MKDGLRIDAFLRELPFGLSRAKARNLCESGEVSVGGRKAKAGLIVYGQEEIEILLDVIPVVPGTFRIIKEELQAFEVDPKLKMEVIYEDETLLCVRKPRGMHSVLQRLSDPFSLADIIASERPETRKAGRDVKESGLVQRLDYWTSGIILACKTRDTWEALHGEFLQKNVEKTYIALIEKGCKISLKDTPFNKIEQLGRDNKELHSSDNRLELIRIYIKDGARHIVRKTLADMQRPLVGDIEYSSPSRGHTCLVKEGASEDQMSVEREGFFLHAESLRFTHPKTGKEIFLKDLQQFILKSDMLNII